MAKENENQPISATYTHTVIYDNHGREIARFGFDKSDQEEDGAIITRNNAENIEGADGTLISPADMSRPSKETRLQRCDICYSKMQRSLFRRNRNRIPYAHKVTMKECNNCHRHLCSRHYRRSPLDNRFRCKTCQTMVFDCV